MSKDCNDSANILQRNGSDQNSRNISILDPQNVNIHDLKVEDWMDFAFRFANEVNYFDSTTNKVDGNWQNFFLKKESISQTLNELKEQGKLSPHLALFVAFLHLLEHSQKRLNNLTKRHLDFYYTQVLKLKPKGPQADQVHVLFELAKKAESTKVDASTRLDAGKDGAGNKLIYETDEELIVNQAQVTKLHIVHHDEQEKAYKYASEANTYDGIGGNFPDDVKKWWPFGHPDYSAQHSNIPKDYPTLPKARLGFYLASPMLRLYEGKRTITFIIRFANKYKPSLHAKNFNDALNIYLSGEKEWIEAGIQSIVLQKANPTHSRKLELKVVVQLDESLDPVFPYNAEVLGASLSTLNAVAKFDFNNDESEGYELYQLLRGKKVEEVNIDVDVQQMQELLVENDLGKMDISKPFFAFGTQAKKGAKMYIACSEALQKPWTEVKIDINWKDTPSFEGVSDHIKELYKAYRKDYLTSLSKSNYTLNTDAGGAEDTADGGLIVSGESYFQAKVHTLKDSSWDNSSTNHQLFTNNSGNYSSTITLSQQSTKADEKALKEKQLLRPKGNKDNNDPFAKKINDETQKEIDRLSNQPKAGIGSDIKTPAEQTGFGVGSKEGFIRYTLQQSFLNELYPKLYATALSKDSEKTLVPNEPYIPIIDSLRVSYKAEHSKLFDIVKQSTEEILLDYLDSSIELFHGAPFGQAEQHVYLKSKHDFVKNTCELVPNHQYGELYIGLEKAELQQNISMLIQVLEGSENPEYEGSQTYQEGEKIAWEILSRNEWKPLNENYILADTTDNFLKSGIIKLTIPKEATSDNTLLPGGYFWLRAINTKAFDAVCQVVDLHTQAQLSTFSNNNNELSHLSTGLPAETISKAVERVKLLKSVIQPYSSFDGHPKETDSAFYRRVSERLRHKQRAITIWDYEHLVLEKFPEIYKVNCLKHTSSTSSLAPGHVTVIVIPNTIDQNIFDAYKPRISKAKRNEIEGFLNDLNTLHVSAKVDNPTYEEVKVSLKVSFYEGLDANYYSKELKKDISKFLAPWAFEKTAEINFGVTLHKSIMIHYIERLNYVDYIEDFELFQEESKSDGTSSFKKVNKVVPSGPRVILTSVTEEQHVVKAN